MIATLDNERRSFDMTTMKRLILSSLGALGLLAAAGGAAHAGFKYASLPVYVYSTSASGGLGYARNQTGDTNQFIGCEVYVIGSPASQTVYCWAQSATRQYASCSTTNPAFISAVESMTDYSYLSFGFDTTGKCTVVATDNESGNTPMVP
jgi:disulfide bond formation protein DsbB